MQPASHDKSQKELKLTLPDGKELTFATPVTGLDVASSIGPGLAKAALAVKLNGEIIDLNRALPASGALEIVTRKSADALEIIRHDTAHVMAEAVQELFPGTQVTIGPSIENGFYYDFARDEPFSTEDLGAIEKKMKEIVARNEPFTREVWKRDEAIRHFEGIGEKYKAEIIRDLPESEEISIYRQGKWYDLCRGPHLPSTGHVGTAFKLMKVAGAYWRGDSNNAQLQRIYGTAWRDQKELDAHLHMLEEAEKRDHRKLGREMDLFHMQEESVGSVFWHDKGYTIWRALEDFIRRRIRAAGYQEVKTPQLFDSSLFKASGHWDIYGDNMFKVEVKADERTLGVKPMNCPAHVQVFNQGLKSYRDLPIRMAEFGCCHRNEPSGAMHGIMRVRQFTQDDAHIFCRDDQVEKESLDYFKLQLGVYKDLGFENISVKLALRPGANERLGSDEVWDRAEGDLRNALTAAGLEFEELPGEGAFYGPKVEFHLTDAIGRTWQCGTLQLDFNLPERLDASYIGEDSQRHRPVMLHRAILGSMERFIGILIEHHAGKLPLWLAPVQCVIATITSDADDYAQEVLEKLKAAGVRAVADVRNEKINYKIREHSLQKIPEIWVVGKREAEEAKVAIRHLAAEGEKQGAQEVLALDAAIRKISDESAPPQ
ncbi:MAG: threonine--tRNA ligase [Alphaproteobacteria bacterium]|nr:threonine--tRNA ligase [Alphaproteobacteria bacterium]